MTINTKKDIETLIRLPLAFVACVSISLVILIAAIPTIFIKGKLCSVKYKYAFSFFYTWAFPSYNSMVDVKLVPLRVVTVLLRYPVAIVGSVLIPPLALISFTKKRQLEDMRCVFEFITAWMVAHNPIKVK